MVGQRILLANLERLKTGFPRFLILVGKRSGRTMVAMHIAKLLNAQYIVVGTKVDEVREAIKVSYTQSEPTLYVISNAESMSLSAKNALLKITEEPPRQAYFLMISSSTSAILNTLLSRGTLLKMDSYSQEDIKEYLDTLEHNLTEEEIQLLTQLSNTPSDCRMLMDYGVVEFESFCNKVINNIGVVSGSNAMKIANSFNFKEDTTKWDASLFLNILLNVCRRRVHDNPALYTEISLITVSYIQELDSASFNKAATFDMWILDVRKAWKELSDC